MAKHKPQYHWRLYGTRKVKGGYVPYWYSTNGYHLGNYTSPHRNTAYGMAKRAFFNALGTTVVWPAP